MHCVLDKIAVEINDHIQQLMQLNDSFRFLMDVKSFSETKVIHRILLRMCGFAECLPVGHKRI